MIPTLITSSHIQLKYIFGMNNQVRNNLYFLDENRVIFPAGYHVVAFHLEDKTQTYFNGVEGYRGFSAMCLSPLRRYLALAARGDKPAIFIFDVLSQKRKKTLIFNQEGFIKEYVSLAFAPGSESKHLISLSGGDGDVILCYWMYDKSRCLASVKISQSPITVYELMFNPLNHNDPNYISIIGPKIFKYYKLTEGVDENNAKIFTLKQLCSQINGVPSEISQNYTCHAWVPCKSKVIVGTENGDLIMLDAECNYELHFKNAPNTKVKAPWTIRCIAAFSKGFVLGGDNLTIFVYRVTDNIYEPFEYVHNFQVISQQDLKEQYINSLCITPNNEERIVCSLSSNVLYGMKLKVESSHAYYEQELQIEPLSLNFHTGAITGMDICVRKPLIATCGEDRYIRIWNYEEKIIETAKAFTTEECFCISIHPSGFQLVCGFQDKLRMMNIIVHNNQIKQYNEIPFKACKEVKYSNGGQYFAAVNSSHGGQASQAIHIFKTYTGENPPNWVFKSHTGKVRCLLWSKDDTMLVSCGAEGMIYAWKIGSEVVKMHDSYNKNIAVFCVALTNDNQTIVASCQDRLFRIYSSDGSEERRDAGALTSQVCFPQSNKVLFAGLCDPQKSAGAIRAYKYNNNSLTGHSSEYQAHDERGVEKLRLTSDDQYLVSAGRDGCLMVFEVKDKEVRGMKLKDGFSRPSEEILITRNDLEDLKQSKENERQKLQEAHAAQNNTLILNSKDQFIKTLMDKISENSVTDNKKYDNLLESKRDLEKKYEEELKIMNENFEAEIQELDTTYQKRVMQEVSKYEDTKRAQDMANGGYEKKMASHNENHRRRIKQIEDESETLLQEERNQRLTIEQEKEKNKEHYKATLTQIVEETTREKANLEGNHASDRLLITDHTLRAKSDVSLTKKKIIAQQQEAQELEEQKKELEDNKKELQLQNQALKIDTDNQKKIIDERDIIIAEKEKKIYELKKRSQELEKFKFVLDHKIKELKKEIGPREDDIFEMKKQTNKMDQKLKEFNNMNNRLGQVVDNLDNAQDKMKEKIKGLRADISYQNVKIKQFKDDVYSAVQFIQVYDELKTQAEKLHKKYVKKNIRPVDIDPDIKAEYISQKKYLDKSVAMLKKNLQKDNEIHKQDNIRIMRENVGLIREINKLRKLKKEHKLSKAPDSEPENKSFSSLKKGEGAPEYTEDEEIILNEKRKFLENQKVIMDNLQKKIEVLEEDQRLLLGV